MNFFAHISLVAVPKPNDGLERTVLFVRFPMVDTTVCPPRHGPQRRKALCCGWSYCRSRPRRCKQCGVERETFRTTPACKRCVRLPYGEIWEYSSNVLGTVLVRTRRTTQSRSAHWWALGCKWKIGDIQRSKRARAAQQPVSIMSNTMRSRERNAPLSSV